MSEQNELKEISQKTLEFDRIKEIIAGYALWSGSRDAVLAMQPMNEIGEVYEQQGKVRQVSEVLESKTDIASGGYEDLTEILTAAEKGVTLAAADFSAICRNLEIVESLKKSLVPWIHLPFILETVQCLVHIPELMNAIKRTFGENGEIRSSASRALSEIRDGRMNAEIAVNAKLGAILRDSSKQKMFQENLWTTREGRFVIPVKQEYRGVFDGLVLDVSTSGATIFMEPVELVSLNNSIKQFQAEEKAEITRILKSLSAMAARNKNELLLNQRTIAEFGRVHALSSYASAANATLPEINTSGRLRLKKARHPLLGSKAVPLDIEIGGDFKALVITGPNTGGKTVSLKTAGLFALMGLSGLPLPAEEGTTIPVLDSVYADIGDDQSIVQNLSTFSSHMNRIISILKEADERTLVLLDELGAGTDPREGTALGIAILEALIASGAKTITTTHYGELKYFASNNPEARNAAMEFDSDTLKPSYRITIGVPGRSCALAIASRLGLPERITKRAERLISHEYVEMDRLLAEIETKERRLDDEISAHSRIKSEAMSLKERYEEDMSLIKAEQFELIAEGAAETDSLIASARNEIRKILSDFRRELRETAESGDRAGAEKAAAANAESRLGGIMDRLKTFRKTKKIPERRDDRQFKPGDPVYIPSMDRRGSIEEIKGDEALVSMNRLKMRIPVWNLRKAKPKDEPAGNATSLPEAKSPGGSINLIGKYADEAVYELEKYLADAVYSQMDSFTVIHGRGTGALKNAVHSFLKRNPAVAEFRLGGPGEGGDGATVVTLK